MGALAREAKADPQAPPASLVPPDRMASLVVKGSEALLAREARAGPLGSRDPPEERGLRAPLVPQASKANAAVPAVRVLRASPAAAGSPALLATTVTQAPRAPVVLQARMAPRAPQETAAAPATPGCLDLKATLAHPARRGPLVPRALRECQGHWASQGSLEHAVWRDPQACPVPGAVLARKA